MKNKDLRIEIREVLGNDFILAEELVDKLMVLFSSRLGELRKGVNKIWDNYQNEYHGGYDDADALMTIEIALNKVYKLIDTLIPKEE